MSKATLLAKAAEDFDRAAAEHTLKRTILEALPDNLALETLYKSGYCAEASLSLSPSNLVEALASLPPQDCSYVLDGSWTVKPTSFLRDNEVPHARWALPVVQKTSPADKGKDVYCWWTEVAGTLVAITAPMTDTSTGELESYVQQTLGKSFDQLHPASHSYSTGHTTLWLRRQKKPSDLGLQSPISQWHAQWENFARAMNYRANQQRFCNMFKMHAEHRDTVELPDRNEGPGNGRWPKFWEIFTEAEAQELLAFAQQQQAALPAIRAEIQVQLAKAEAWCREFFAQPFSFGDGRGSRRLHDNFSYHFYKETGVAATLNWANFARSDESLIEIGITLDKEHVRPLIENNTQLPLFDWESVAEYY